MNQSQVIHTYATAAGLSRMEYVALLKGVSGVASTKDPDFTQSAADRFMAAIETILFDRVGRGEVPNPIGRSRIIRSEYYWRHRLPKAGYINSRHLALINRLWDQLCEFLEPEQRTPIYFAGIVHKATGKNDVGVTCLTAAEAGHVIDALRDRLSYAIRPKAELPF